MQESRANKTLTDVFFGRRESGCRSDADMLLLCCMAARATGEHTQAHKNALGYTPPAFGKKSKDEEKTWKERSAEVSSSVNRRKSLHPLPLSLSVSLCRFSIRRD